MTDLKEVRIIGPRCTSQEALHEFVAKKLGFLSEMGEPVRITFAIGEHDIEPGMQAYLLRFVQVCAREALVNENVSLVIEHP